MQNTCRGKPVQVHRQNVKFWLVPERSAAIWSPRLFQHWMQHKMKDVQHNWQHQMQSVHYKLFVPFISNSYLMHKVHTNFFSFIMWELVIKVTSETIKTSIQKVKKIHKPLITNDTAAAWPLRAPTPQMLCFEEQEMPKSWTTWHTQRCLGFGKTQELGAYEQFKWGCSWGGGYSSSWSVQFLSLFIV